MEGRHRLSSALALAVLVLPLATFYSGRQWQQVYDSGFFSTPLWGFTALALAIIAHQMIVPWNVWIGRWVMSIALISPLAEPYSLAMATWGVAGAVVAKTVSGIERSRVVLALTVFGLIEIGLLTMQWCGVYIPFGDWQWQVEIPHGTFGNPRYLAVALSMAGAVAPLWAIPVFFGGLILCKSYAALGAFVVALGFRYRREVWAWPPIGFIAMAGGFLLYQARNFTHDSWESRLWLFSLAVDEMKSVPLSLLVGIGDGSWYTHMLDRQMGVWFAINGHSEYMQVFYERGLIGLAFVVAFMVVHRRWFLREPALVALAVCCSTLSALHLTMVAPVACVVIGMAARESGQSGSTFHSPLWCEEHHSQPCKDA